MLPGYYQSCSQGTTSHAPRVHHARAVHTGAVRTRAGSRDAAVAMTEFRSEVSGFPFTVYRDGYDLSY